MTDTEKIIKTLSSGFKSSEFTALVSFILIVLLNVYIGDNAAVKMITDTSLDPAMTDLISMVRNKDAQSMESLRLILYAVLGYFVKRGLLKWKEIEITSLTKKEISKKKSGPVKKETPVEE